jgi:hypothetical protein
MKLRNNETLTSKGAYDTIRSGVLRMASSRKTLDTEFLSSVTLTEIGNYFELPLFETKNYSSTQQPPRQCETTDPSKEKEKTTTLYPLAILLKRAMNETGLVLKEGGFKDFAQFVRTHVQPLTLTGTIYDIKEPQSQICFSLFAQKFSLSIIVTVKSISTHILLFFFQGKRI